MLSVRKGGDSMGFLFTGIFFMIFLVVALIALAVYLLMAIPLFVMARNANIDLPWLAFIPFGNYYIACKLSTREFNLFDKIILPERYYAALIILAASVCGGAISAVPIIGSLLSLAVMICVRILYWKIMLDVYDTYRDGDYNVLAIISAIFPIVFAIVLWTIKDTTPNYNV